MIGPAPAAIAHGRLRSVTTLETIADGHATKLRLTFLLVDNDPSRTARLKLPKIDSTSLPTHEVSSEPIRMTGRRPSDRDVLARLAVYYLMAEPYRYGLLQRELEAYYKTGVDRDFDRLRRINRDEGTDALRAELQRRAVEKLAAVGGNRELLGPRRADAVWIDITDPRKPTVEIHEIKTARGDLVNELRRPAKSAVWMQRAHRFWLTVPDAALFDDLDVPDAWGVLVLPFGRAPHVVRPAPALTPSVTWPRGDAVRFVIGRAMAREQWNGLRWRVGWRLTVASRVRSRS